MTNLRFIHEDDEIAKFTMTKIMRVLYKVSLRWIFDQTSALLAHIKLFDSSDPKAAWAMFVSLV